MTGSFGRLARPAPKGLSFRKSHVNRKVLVRFTNSIPCVAANKGICRAPRSIFPQYSTPDARLTGGPRCGRASLACAPAPRHASQRLRRSSKDDATPAQGVRPWRIALLQSRDGSARPCKSDMDRRGLIDLRRYGGDLADPPSALCSPSSQCSALELLLGDIATRVSDRRWDRVVSGVRDQNRRIGRSTLRCQGQAPKQ